MTEQEIAGAVYEAAAALNRAMQKAVNLGLCVDIEQIERQTIADAFTHVQIYPVVMRRRFETFTREPEGRFGQKVTIPIGIRYEPINPTRKD